MKKSLLLATSLLILTTPALAEVDAQPAQEEVKEHSHVHWSYTGEGAAHNWGDLKEDYHACKDGEKQSPIDIRAYQEVDLPDLQLAYNATPLNVVNNGHALQVNYAPGSSLSVGDTTYELLHFHFHTPSEHYLDGAPYPMEVHFVHKAADGTLGVVGVALKVGVANPTIEAIWQNAPLEQGEKQVDDVLISAVDLLPKPGEQAYPYYKYEGSLTTPPCSEGVQWHVLKEPIEISAAQLRAFQKLFPINARPIQSLNGRIVSGG